MPFILVSAILFWRRGKIKLRLLRAASIVLFERTEVLDSNEQHQSTRHQPLIYVEMVYFISPPTFPPYTPRL